MKKTKDQTTKKIPSKSRQITNRTKLMVIIAAILLLAVSSINLVFLEHDAARISKDFAPLYTALQQEDQENAQYHMNKIVKSWKKSEIYWHLVIDHKELEKVESSLVLLEAQVQNAQFNEAKAALAQLRFSLLHIPQTESLCIENIL